MLRELQKTEFTLGVPIPHGVYDRQGKLLLRRGFVIEHAEQLTRLIERGAFRDDAEDARLAALAARKSSPNITVGSAQQEPSSVYERIGASTLRLKPLITDLRSPQPSEAIGDRVGMLAREILVAVREDVDAALAAVHLDFHNLYILSHQVHSAALCAIAGDYLNLPETELRSLMCAALTCDIGMIDSPEFERQKGPLSDSQKALLRSHPARAAALLRKADVTDSIWLDAVANHHERADGTGYPGGTLLERVPMPQAILSVADAYLAMIKTRPWREAMIPLAAFKDLFAMKTSGLCANGSQVCDVLVKVLGMYPPGSIVRLANTEVAVITRRGKDMRTPIAYSLYEKSGIPRLTPIPRDTADPAFAIKAALSYSECRSVSLIIPRIWTRRN